MVGCILCVLQLLDKARGDVTVLTQQLQDSQAMLAESQHALAVSTATVKDLRAELDTLTQQLDRQQTDSQQQQQHVFQHQTDQCSSQHQQDARQQMEATAVTPSTCKGRLVEAGAVTPSTCKGHQVGVKLQWSMAACCKSGLQAKHMIVADVPAIQVHGAQHC